MSPLVAITRELTPSIAACQLTFLQREPIDFDRAVEQHASYCDALRDAGVAVTVLPGADHLPDAVFVEDTAFVLDEIAIVTRPGSEARRPEVAAVDDALRAHREVRAIEPPGTLDGGDILKIGRTIFVGRSRRSNQEGFAQLSDIVSPFGYRAIPASVRHCLHLKTAATALNDETLLVNRGWLEERPFRLFRQIEVPDEESFAANALSLGGVVHLASGAPRTRDLLDGRGFATRVVDMSELAKAEGGLTCCSVIFRAR